jgi:hypothetical protein
MCFSTQASFAAGTILTIAGAATLTKVRERSQIPFALIPLIFAIQQFTEGFVWMSLLHPNSSKYAHLPMYLFLIIAQVVWPVWVPLSIWFIEQDKKRKKIMALLVVTGIIFSVNIIYVMLHYPTQAEIRHLHIHYGQKVPQMLIRTGALFYFLATVVAPFISRDRHMQLLGLIILVSFLVSKLFFADNVVSVWCFFAAILSVIIYFILAHRSKSYLCVNESETHSFS